MTVSVLMFRIFYKSRNSNYDYLTVQPRKPKTSGFQLKQKLLVMNYGYLPLFLSSRQYLAQLVSPIFGGRVSNTCLSNSQQSFISWLQAGARSLKDGE